MALAGTRWQPLARRTAFAGGGLYVSFFLVAAFQMFNLTSWLGAQGIGEASAGRLQGLMDLFFIPGVLLAGLLADWRGFTRQLFLGFFLVAGLGYLLLGVGNQAWVFAIALALIGFAFLPLTNLMDTHLQPYVTRDLLPYARVRVAGSIAFTLVLLTVALMTEAQLLDLFYPAILGCFILVGVSLIALPGHPDHQPTPFTARLKTFGQLLAQRRFLIFFIAVALIFGSHGAHYIYAVEIWRDWGFSSAQIYGVLAWSVTAEIIFFLVVPKALTERRAAPLLAICAVGAIMRWIFWPFATSWVALLVIHSLHVVTFALTHLTALAFLRRRVPEGQLGAAQALLPAISVGLGMATSKWIAASFFDWGAVWTFWAMAAFAALALPLLWALNAHLGPR